MLNATLEKTEMEISYFPFGGSISDYQINIRNTSYGVSVTRGYKFGSTFTEIDAKVLLMKKLKGVLVSSQLVMNGWKKQMLHVLIEEDYIAQVLKDVYQNSIPDDIKKDTLVFVTVVKNAHWVMKQ